VEGGGANTPEAVEASGKTVDDAIENGLVDLGLERHEVSVEVMTPGRPGLFGIGGEPARVRLTPASQEAAEGDEVGYAQDVLENLIRLMGIEAEVTTRAPETPGDGVGRTKAVLDINGDDLGILIGRRGLTMASLQYLLNLAVNKRYRSTSPFQVDVEGYRRRREEWLRDLAFRMAERVRSTGRSITLEPMPPNERRIVHLTLAKDPTVATESVGEGERRKVAIIVRR
jgi:spoIIIJ-associated protein